MTLADNWRQMRFLAGLVIVSTAVILLVLLVGFLNQHAQVDRDHRQAERDHALLVQVQLNAALNIETSARTECIRKLGAAVDDERWNLVGQAFHAPNLEVAAALGRQLSALPQALDVADHGGMIGKKSYRTCPPPPKPITSGTLPAATTGGSP